jgi:predicted RNase H-like nuclease
MQWLKDNGKSIFPIPNRGVIYAGFGKTNLTKMKKNLQAEPEAIPMWKIIEKAEKDAKELRLKFQVQHPAPIGHRMLRWTNDTSTSTARNVA